MRNGFVNYDDVIDQLQAYGLLVNHVDIDTPKPRRCQAEGSGRETRGWYWLSSFATADGNHLITGAYGIYQGNDNGKQTITVSKDQRDRLTPEQIKAQKARQKAAQKHAEQERQREADKAAAKAIKAWKNCATTGSSEYLQRKQIEAYGVRFSPNGSLVIPMTDSRGTVRGLQFILPRGHERISKIGRDKEFWPKGLAMAGTYHLIGDHPKDLLLIAEGYATAASIHQATGHPVAVVWSANNILPACQQLHQKYRRAKILICADDDATQLCSACGKYTSVATADCQHCSQPHRKNNAGVTNSQAAAIAINGEWVTPQFQQRPAGTKGPTDFNDLHVSEGLHAVADQISAKLAASRWITSTLATALPATRGEGKTTPLKSILSIDEATDRFALVYGGKGTMFDFQEHILVPKADVLDILPEHGWRDMRATKQVVRIEEVGFDPTGTDTKIRCNLWGGWPTEPKPGKCDCLLELLNYLCSNEEDCGAQVADWVIKWLAYPIQHPGAKMRTALVFHGPQGAGKNLFFEAVMAIYGEYGRIVNQDAIEDKFNDWASKKLFLIADEVVARTELFHIKNKLKCFVTGEWIRINPKNVAAHDERNHVNIVFLSNESQPLVLEKDDRRYTVIHTPATLPEQFYQLVGEEIKNGGIAALHHHLQTINLGDFDPHSKPPVTRAKANLIDVSIDSVNSFIRDWTNGEIRDIPFCPCLGTDLFKIYNRHCEATRERSPRTLRQFIGAIRIMDGWKAGDPYWVLKDLHGGQRLQRKMVIPPARMLHGTDHAKGDDQTQEQWLTEKYLHFAATGGLIDA